MQQLKIEINTKMLLAKKLFRLKTFKMIMILTQDQAV